MLIFLIVVAGSTSRPDEQEIQNTQNAAEDGEVVFVILPVCDSHDRAGCGSPNCEAVLYSYRIRCDLPF